MSRLHAGEADEVRLRLRVRKHIETLGCYDVEDYGRWCAKRGFRASVDKTRGELSRERDRWQQERLREGHTRKLHRNPRKLIDAICRQEVRSNELGCTLWRSVCARIEAADLDPASRESLRELLSTVRQRGSFLTDTARFGDEHHLYVDALIKLNDRRHQWIRPPRSWQPTSHNRRRQFGSLARHLMARYPVPAFLDSVWFRQGYRSRSMRSWFEHVGSGRSLRTARTPVPFTRRMAHLIQLAPEDDTVERAVLRAQVGALGGDARLVEALIGSRMVGDYAHWPFWIEVIRFFVEHPTLDRSHAAPIVDYLRSQKFEQRELVARGGVEVRPPARPHLSMRRRSPATLLREVEAWHRELARTGLGGPVEFRPSGIRELWMPRCEKTRKRWIVRELLSGAALLREGRVLRHCVSSYATACTRGWCSIWTMELETEEVRRKHQTIEVNASGSIVQCRGKRNALPTEAEMQVLRTWAREAGLTIAAHIGPR